MSKPKNIPGRPYLCMDGKHRISVRVEHRLHLDGMIDALVRDALDTWAPDEPDDLPPVMPPAKVLESVRDALGRHGSENVWAWCDDMDSDEVDSYRSWARGIILRHWPDLSV